MGAGTLPEFAERSGLIRPGIVAALAEEAAAITGAAVAAGVVVDLAGGGLIILSGMGPRRARAAGEQLLAGGAGALLSWGCAGALDERLAPGCLLLPGAVIAADGAMLLVDPDWHDRLRRRLAGQLTLSTHYLAESLSVVTNPAEKQALHRRTQAVAVDMESAALGRLAREAGVPFAVIRVIADSARMQAPPPMLAAVDPLGQARIAPLLAGLICSPRQWLPLARLYYGFRAAKTTLNKVAGRLNGDWRAQHHRDTAHRDSRPFGRKP